MGVRDQRPVFTDALGELTELTGQHLTVTTARGPVRVPLREVARARRVPPRRPRPAEIIALELAANQALPAPEQERLGGWLLRAADGWTGRGNSALPIGDPGRPLDAAIDAVRAWYSARGLAPAVNVPLPLAGDVDAALAARGWRAGTPVLVQTAALSTVLAAVPARADLPPVRLAGTPSDGWLAVAAARKGGFPAAAMHMLTAVPEVCFAEVYDGGELLAIARGTVTGATGPARARVGGGGPDDERAGDRETGSGADGGAGRYFGIMLVEVVPAARRRGLARHVIGGLGGWAAARGAGTAYLQVEQTNTAAISLYHRLGLRTHHRYLPRRTG